MRLIGLGVVLALSLLAPLAVEGQQAGKVPRIGFLAFSTCESPDPIVRQFRQALATLGYVDGKTIIIECRRITGDQPDQNRVRAEELVTLKTDLIVAQGTPSAVAAQRATRTTPIVMFNVADPVARGLVAGLTRPGGNVTGLTNLIEGQTQKSLEVLKEGAPRVFRVAVLVDLSNEAQLALRAEQDVAARALGLKLQRLDVRGPSDLDAALAAILRERAQALYLLPLPAIGRVGTERIMAFAIKHQLPTLGAVSPLYAQAGVMFFFSHNLTEQFQRLAAYVDKILKGTKPADLPVEQPTKFELVINLKTAKALGLTIPQTLLIRADQIIE